MIPLALFSLLVVALASWKSSSHSSSYSQYGPAVRLPNGNVYNVELMSTPEERRLGMQFRNRFPAHTVMVFAQPQPSFLPIHMMNVRMALDAVWLNSAGRIVQIRTLHPERGVCASSSPAQFLIEAPKGWAEHNRLEVGDQMEFGNVPV
jgi:uncharacterized membrane protein (UPF0127 family)